MSPKAKVLVIAGPTAVGKTALSLELARTFQGEIINGDSQQVYHELNIGTGKIQPEEMGGIPHHLLGHVSYRESYDVSRFQKEADQLIHKLNEAGKLPIIEGGSGLYLQSLIDGLELGGKGSQDPQVRQALNERLEALGPLALWEELKALDPQAASKIPYQNSRRTIRALEVIQLTGELFSKQAAAKAQESPYDSLVLVLDRPRPELYERINQRVCQMVDQELEAEVRSLYEASGDQAAQLQSLRAIGYKEWLPYFQGAMTLDQVLAAIQQNSRRYAKRQLTWLRNRMPASVWLDNSQEDQAIDQALRLVGAFISDDSRQDEKG